jgi:hypothetical protein
MKTCPTCQRKYTDPSLSYCLDEGSRLIDPLESAETLLNHLPPDADSEATLVNAMPQDTGSEATQGFASDPFPAEPHPGRPTDPTLVIAPINPSYTPPPGTGGRSNRGTRIGLIIGLVAVVLAVGGVFGAGALVWMFQSTNANNSPVAKKPAEIPSPSPTATPRETPTESPSESPTPEVPDSATGSWTGTWSNSKGNSGTSTIEITEGPKGEITGSEGDDFVMANGHRDGNILTWQYIGAGDTCLDYTCTFEIDASGTKGRGSYKVEDTCQDTTFTGTYISYTKQQD